MTDLFQDTPLFHETEGNPRPENATGGFFVTRDRKKIRYGLFAAVARPMRGTVVLLSGRNEAELGVNVPSSRIDRGRKHAFERLPAFPVTVPA